MFCLTLTQGYAGALWLGAGYALVCGALTGLAGHGHGPLLSHGTDLRHHGHGRDGHELRLHPAGPTMLSLFLATFGATGLILHEVLHWPATGVFVCSAAAGTALSTSVACIFAKALLASQSSSEARVSELSGLTAEVTTAIPAGGLGEIAYVCRGTRYTGPAKTADGRALPAGESVTILVFQDAAFEVAADTQTRDTSLSHVGFETR